MSRQAARGGDPRKVVSINKHKQKNTPIHTLTSSDHCINYTCISNSKMSNYCTCNGLKFIYL